MSEHEVARPVNGQVYRDNFESINWGGNRLCDWLVDTSAQDAIDRKLDLAASSTGPVDSEGKALAWNPLIFGYE